MADKLIAGALVYREVKGTPEWFLAKSGAPGVLEIPKSDVRRGESSVSAAIRYMKETAGLRITVLEEAGRMNMTAKAAGQALGAKVLVYLMRENTGEGKSEFTATIEGQWLKYSIALKKLDLAREQKVLKSASSILKEWQKTKKIKKRS